MSENSEQKENDAERLGRALGQPEVTDQNPKLMEAPVCKTFRLKQPLDCELQSKLISAGMAAGFQVISEGPELPPVLLPEKVSLEDLGLAEMAPKGTGVNLLLIDSERVIFISASEEWCTTARLETRDDHGYIVQFGAQADIYARKDEERRAQETAKRHERRAKGRKPRTVSLRNLYSKVRKMKAAGYTHQEMCCRLGKDPRPPGATWGHLTWPEAFDDEKYGNAVTKWLTDASS
jgi:hypothetical protein